MAYRELGMVELREIVRRWLRGDGIRAIARATGMDRKTIAAYMRAAVAAGVQRGGPPPTDEQLAAIGAARRPGRRPNTLAPSPELHAVRPHEAAIRQWLAEGLRLTKIYRRLRAQGVAVSYSSLYRFARAACDFGTPAVTVRVADPPPGEAAEIDFGRLGLWLDPATGRRRAVYGLLVTLCFSRYAFLWVALRQDLSTVLEGLEAAWVFFGGVVRRLVEDNLKPVVLRPDRYNPHLQRVFLEYAQYRGFVVDPAVPEHARGKPKVERGIPYCREDFFRGESFRDLARCRRTRSSGAATSPARACMAPHDRCRAWCSRPWSNRRSCHWRSSPLIAPRGPGPPYIPTTTSSSAGPSTRSPRPTSASASRSGAIPASCGSITAAR